MRKVACIICSMSLLFVAGCATAIQGRYQTIAINSTPQGAKITSGSTGKHILMTPGEVTIIRNVPVTLWAQKEGYHSARQEFEPQLSNWIFGNAFLWTYGIITAAFDYAFGAGFELEPKEIHFELVPKVKELSLIAPLPEK